MTCQLRTGPASRDLLRLGFEINKTHTFGVPSSALDPEGHQSSMPDDPNNNADPSSSSPAVPRSKQHRAATTSAAVRPRTSPTPGDHDPRPPTKRARKAINCEPCRNSKLKCDRYESLSPPPFLLLTLTRNRPCSSCVLRGSSRHSTCFPSLPPTRYNRTLLPRCQRSRVRTTPP